MKVVSRFTIKHLTRRLKKSGDNVSDMEAGVAFAVRSSFKTQMEHL